MENLPFSEPCLPNKFGRLLLLAVEEILGRNAVMATLRMAGLPSLMTAYPPNNLDFGFPFRSAGAIHQALEDLYGPRGGRGVALRAGRALFKHGLRELGSSLGVSDLSFRLLPLNMKLKAGAESFLEIFKRYTHQVIVYEEEPESFLWHVEACPLCWGRKTDSPCCHLGVGLVQESLYWLSGGKNFVIEELSCFARGDSRCTFAVARKPLD
jgi:predicted hydrocarbon binding protein